MNVSTNLRPNERLLKKERTHAGIFAIPAVILLAFSILLLPFFVVIKIMQAPLTALTPPGSTAAFNFLWAIPGILLLLVAVGIFAVTLLAYLSSEVVLTNRRLSFRAGVLRRVAGELPLENVEATFISEPLLGRLFGYGTVSVSGIGGVLFPLAFIGRPHEFYSLLRGAVAEAKSTSRVAPRAMPVQDDSRYMPKD